jgi:3-oxoacyl-[acyl-carrier-protein] synthase-1
MPPALAPASAPALPLALCGAGCVTGAGLSLPATAAAVRTRLSALAQTRFMDARRGWIDGVEIPLDPPLRGRRKLLTILAAALAEAFGESALPPAEIPLLIGVAEPTRPGRFAGLDATLLTDLASLLGLRLHPDSALFPAGRVAIAPALLHARALLAAGRCPAVLVAGVDTLLVGPTLAALDAADLLQSGGATDGIVPGEAAAALLIRRADKAPATAWTCVGIGLGLEPSDRDPEAPLRADGLVTAIRAALAEAGTTFDAIGLRVADIAGDERSFYEASLAQTRLLRAPNLFQDIALPADSTGDVGAAFGALLVALTTAAGLGLEPLPKQLLIHLHRGSGERAALILRRQA